MSQLGFYFDNSRCTGCKTCQVACKDFKDLKVGVNYRRVYEYAGGDWQQNTDGSWQTDTFAYYVSVACNHCDNPYCVQVCPHKALVKRADNGLVILDSERCTGCGKCAQACPYGAPQFDRDMNKMRKCDGCIERLTEGKNTICVEACPLRALDFGDISELKAKYGEGVQIAPLPQASWTRPNFLIKPGRKAKPVGDKQGSIQNLAEV